jgi:hypothetical protein
MTQPGHAFENVAGESQVVATEDFDFESLFAGMDGEPTDDAIKAAKIEGAEQAVFWLLDKIISKHTPGTSSRSVCRQTGFRAIMLALSLHHPSVADIKSIRAFAKSYGMNHAVAVRSSRRIRKKFGMA